MKKFLVALMMVFALSACKEEKNGESLKGHEFKVMNALNDADLRISFDGETGMYYGKVINNFRGAYKVDGNKITFGPAMSTLMAGDPDMMKIEYEYVNFFPQVKTFRFDGDTLILSTETDDVSFQDMGKISKE